MPSTTSSTSGRFLGVGAFHVYRIFLLVKIERHSRLQDLSKEMHVLKNVKNTVSKPHVVLHNSQNVNILFLCKETHIYVGLFFNFC